MNLSPRLEPICECVCMECGGPDGMHCLQCAADSPSPEGAEPRTEAGRNLDAALEEVARLATLDQS